jgi:hypothetical protein
MSYDIVTPPDGMTEVDFCGWIGGAEPGDRIVYHVGFLAIDREAATSRLGAFAMAMSAVRARNSPFTARTGSRQRDVSNRLGRTGQAGGTEAEILRVMSAAGQTSPSMRPRFC